MADLDTVDPAKRDEVIVHVSRREGGIVETRGMLLALWVTPLNTALLEDTRRSLASAKRRHPDGVTTLSIHRLDKRYPIGDGYDSNLGEILETMRAVRTSVRVSAVAVEFNGLLGHAMRSAISALRVFAGSEPVIKVFDRTMEALVWLLPQTPASGGVQAIGHFLDVVSDMTARFEREQVRPESAEALP